MFESSLRNIFSSVTVKTLGDIASPCRIPLLVENSCVSLYILNLALATLFMLVRVSIYGFSFFWLVRASVTALGYMESR